MMITILDPTFERLAGEAIDKAHEATRAYFSIKPEERTPRAANAAALAMKEAGAPLQHYVLVQRMGAKAWKLIKFINLTAR